MDGLHDDDLKSYVLVQQPKKIARGWTTARLKYSVTKRSTSSNTATTKTVLTQLVTSLAQAPLTQSIEATNSVRKDDDTKSFQIKLNI